MHTRLLFLLLILLPLCYGCDESPDTSATVATATTATITPTQVAAPPAITPDETPAQLNAVPPAEITTTTETPTQFNIGNKNYLFDVSDHSIEELEALLKRAQEISQLDSSSYKDLEIVMILHGPDVDWFTQKNYERNRQLVDLAAKLDAFDIIDMKVCETTMAKRGVNREDIPAFIESVPYAPEEMKRLSEAGYTTL